MSDPLFIFGTLRHLPLLEVVVDGLDGLRLRAAMAPGFEARAVPGAAYPALVQGDAGAALFAEGLLIEGLDPVQRARLDFFEAGFGYGLRAISVSLAQGARGSAQVYWPEATPQVSDKAWDFHGFEAVHGPIWAQAAQDVMSHFGVLSGAEVAAMMPTMLMRAASRLRAGKAAPCTLRSGFSGGADVAVNAARVPYVNYFQVAEQDLAFRTFGGDMSGEVTRAGFVSGDAVTVLPYDPASDTVLVIEQFRMGPFLRGDPKPWMLEPIAGRIDPGEAPETCARREAEEEAGLVLGGLEPVAQSYPSPGAMSEFLYSYVAVTDLSGQGGAIHGLDSEDEDIRTHVIGFDRFMALVESGEVGCTPLVMSAFWLALNRDRLRAHA